MIYPKVITNHFLKLVSIQSKKIITNFSIAKPRKQKTLYQVLQIPTNASPTIIRKNYLKLAKIYHPDVYKGADKDRFEKIKQAYTLLSNEKERRQYDEKIGIKININEQEIPSPRSSDDQTNQYGKKNTPFSYQGAVKKEIDLDEEYQKFFKKKSSTHFEEIRLHEDPQFRAMNEPQRVRRRFTEVYSDPKLMYKMQTSKTYPQILDDQIRQKNLHEEDIKKDQERIKKYQNIDKDKRFILFVKISLAIMFSIAFPYFYSERMKRQYSREIKRQFDYIMGEIQGQITSAQARSRMSFN